MSEENKTHILDDEKHLVLDHDYDGIQELNHPLPSWWVGIWVLSFAFSIPYVMYYIMLDGPGLTDEFQKEMVTINKIKEEEAKNSANFDMNAYSTWVAQNDGVKKGAVVFEENCLSCHAEGGGGDIGPNLTDKHWLNVKEVNASSLYSVVLTGVEENGMPAWGEILSKEDMMAVVSYVLTLQGTTPPKAKEPQGELIE